MEELNVGARSEQALYFVNRWVDWLAIGGLSILAWVCLRSFHSGTRSELVIALGMQLSWFVNWPHFSATLYRLYQSREHVAQYPKTARLLPPLILVGVALGFVLPDTFAPLWVKVFLIWSPYHFSGQSFGISMLYARRAGWTVTPALRQSLRVFIYCTFLLGVLRAEEYLGSSSWYDIEVVYFGLPSWVADLSGLLLYGSLASTLLLIAHGGLRGGGWPPAIFLLPATAQYLWFVPGASWLSFSEFVPLFHSLQYLLIAWSLQLTQRHLQGSGRGGTFVFRESLRWGGVNFVGGALLFFGAPQLASALTGASLFFSTGVVIAGVQLHHFVVDGVIWRLRRETVRSPLMGSIGELFERRTVQA